MGAGHVVTLLQFTTRVQHRFLTAFVNVCNSPPADVTTSCSYCYPRQFLTTGQLFYIVLCVVICFSKCVVMHCVILCYVGCILIGVFRNVLCCNVLPCNLLCVICSWFCTVLFCIVQFCITMKANAAKKPIIHEFVKKYQGGHTS